MGGERSRGEQLPAEEGKGMDHGTGRGAPAAKTSHLIPSACAPAASASARKPSRPGPLRQISVASRVRICFRAASMPLSRASVPLPCPPRAAFAPLSSAYRRDGRLPT